MDLAAERVFAVEPRWLESADGNRMAFRARGWVHPATETDGAVVASICSVCGSAELLLRWLGPAPYGAGDDRSRPVVDGGVQYAVVIWTDAAVAWCKKHGLIDRQALVDVPYDGAPTLPLD